MTSGEAYAASGLGDFQRREVAFEGLAAPLPVRVRVRGAPA